MCVFSTCTVLNRFRDFVLAYLSVQFLDLFSFCSCYFPPVVKFIGILWHAQARAAQTAALNKRYLGKGFRPGGGRRKFEQPEGDNNAFGAFSPCCGTFGIVKLSIDRRQRNLALCYCGNFPPDCCPCLGAPARMVVGLRIVCIEILSRIITYSIVRIWRAVGVPS